MTTFRPLPAVDLRGGRCVQLVGGRPEDERVSLPDPVAVAERWRSMGFDLLHVVDLDAALGTGDNFDLVRKIARGGPVQVGGGIRDREAIRRMSDAGVERMIVGTRAVDDPEWLASVADEVPDRIVVASDIRDGMVLRKGWVESSDLPVADFLGSLAGLPLAGILCTDVGREGRLEGIDREGVLHAIAHAPHPLWISGGITTIEELEFLADSGAAGAVLGMALYTGRIDPELLL